VDIHVEKTDPFSGQGKGHGNVCGHGTLANASLAGEDHEFMLDPAERFFQFFVLVPAAFAASVAAGAR
jgi:hypothetical protein